MNTRIADTAKTLAVASALLLGSILALPATASTACGDGASADQSGSYWSQYWERRSRDGQ